LYRFLSGLLYYSYIILMLSHTHLSPDTNGYTIFVDISIFTSIWLSNLNILYDELKYTVDSTFQDKLQNIVQDKLLQDISVTCAGILVFYNK